MKAMRSLIGFIFLLGPTIPAGSADLNIPRPQSAPAIYTPTGPTKPAPTERSVFNYGASDKTCIEWTDSCVNCARVDGDQGRCSNIGIACQPKKIRCVRR
jgi:hypothetical protein